MAVPRPYQADVRAIAAKRTRHGADFWASGDGGWGQAATAPYREILANIGSR